MHLNDIDELWYENETDVKKTTTQVEKLKLIMLIMTMRNYTIDETIINVNFFIKIKRESCKFS